MGEDPTAIREQIEATRERVADTVDALSYRADVPTRAKESINDKVESVRGKLVGTRSRIADAAPDADDVKGASRQAVGVVQENPIGLAIGAAAVGFLAGMFVPSTTIENEQLGPVSDQVKEQVKQTGQEALERGKQVAQETVQTAAESAKNAASEVADHAQQTAQHEAEELKASAQENADQVRQATPLQ